MISLEQFITTSRGKTHEKKFRSQNFGLEIKFFAILKFASLGPLDPNRDRNEV